MYVKKLRGVEEREFLTTHTKKKRPKWKRSFKVIFIFRIFLCKGLCGILLPRTQLSLSLLSVHLSSWCFHPSFSPSVPVFKWIGKRVCIIVGIIIRLEKIKKRDTNFFYLDFLGLSLLIFCYYYTFSLHCFILCVDIFTSCLYIIHHTPVSVVFHFPYQNNK